MDNQKGIDASEKEMLGHFQNMYLKLKIIFARTLLKSFQPIHRLINNSSKLYKIKRLKNKKWNIDNWGVDNSEWIFQELKNGYL